MLGWSRIYITVCPFLSVQSPLAGEKWKALDLITFLRTLSPKLSEILWSSLPLSNTCFAFSDVVSFQVTIFEVMLKVLPASLFSLNILFLVTKFICSDRLAIVDLLHHRFGQLETIQWQTEQHRCSRKTIKAQRNLSFCLAMHGV